MSEQANPAELGKVYDPASFEAQWYALWEQRGYFRPETASAAAPAYTVVLPPPNVTGRLHMGHALTATIEDTMVRWHRMRGFRALWLPGTDHAGIATQVMVERELAKEGSSREAIGREAFMERVWDWKEEHGGIIDTQHKSLGASLDWSRYRFTLDDVSSRAVKEAFCRLHEQGLIYRAHRLINWDHASKTALSDLEVEHETTQGKLWHLAYPIAGSDERLVVATTRPETMLGDTAVAVHPEDPRYKHLVGKEVELPLCDRRIPIVGDAILVDMEFGTGAVKVTPAHDFNDFETGKRHELELIQVIDFDAKICAPAPAAFVGMTVAEARKAVVSALDEAGVLVKTEDHELAVGKSQRTGVVVEPLPSTQWFMRVEGPAKKALDAVREGDTTIIPSHRTRDYYRWMENIHDWCISRQLWWGHRIPAWYCAECEHITVGRDTPTACEGCGSNELRQDEDVLDTWFSSGLWPLTTLGWPDEDAWENSGRAFYPTSLMETGWDILFFWVARMMMFGLHFTGEVPFKTVFLHSMVLGEDGQKMSKTKGNVVDPVELIDAYGADALRFYLCTMAGQELGIVFSRARVEGYRNFCTKLWNAARFVQMRAVDMDLDAWRERALTPEAAAKMPLADRWILREVIVLARDFDAHLKDWRLDLAAHRAYQFVWHEFCDWYLELVKRRLRDDASLEEREQATGTLWTVLDLVLRLLHPMIPFITEEIWTKIPRPGGTPESLMVAPCPSLEAEAGAETCGLEMIIPGAKALVDSDAMKSAAQDLERLIEVVHSVRRMKAETRLPPAKRVTLLARSERPEVVESLQRIEEALTFVGRVESLTILGPEDVVPREAVEEVLDGGLEVILPLAGLVDLDEERARVAKALAKREKELSGLERKLGNEGFVNKAPPELVERERGRLEELRAGVEKQRALLERLGGGGAPS